MCSLEVNKLGAYAASGVNKPENSKVDKFKDGLNDEISFRQATVKVEYLKRMLNEPNLSLAERNAAEQMLRDAQRDLAQLQQDLNKKYDV